MALFEDVFHRGGALRTQMPTLFLCHFFLPLQFLIRHELPISASMQYPSAYSHAPIMVCGALIMD